MYFIYSTTNINLKYEFICHRESSTKFACQLVYFFLNIFSVRQDLKIQH